MAGVGAQTFTFQLSTKTAEKTGLNVEQYRLQLTPSVNVPFTAQPRCQLEQLAFTIELARQPPLRGCGSRARQRLRPLQPLPAS